MKVVIKHGGSVLDVGSSAAMLEAVANLRSAAVLVHGGGPLIDAALARSGIRSSFVDGVRITPPSAMPIVEAVLTEVNGELARALRRAGQPAIGVSGVSSALFSCRRAYGPGGKDLGSVGVVTSVNVPRLESWLHRGLVPVVAPVGAFEDGSPCNVNADEVASAIAGALGAQLVMVTDVPGVIIGGNLCAVVDEEQLERSIASGSITGGMIQKTRACVRALRAGAPSASIVDSLDDLLLGGTKVTATAAGVS